MSASPPWYGWPPVDSSSGNAAASDPGVAQQLIAPQTVEGGSFVVLASQTVRLVEPRALMVWAYLYVVPGGAAAGLGVTRISVDGTVVAVARQYDGSNNGMTINSQVRSTTLAAGDHVVEFLFEGAAETEVSIGGGVLDVTPAVALSEPDAPALRWAGQNVTWDGQNVEW